MSSDSKNLFGFLVIKFSEVEQTLISLGCRQLRNCTLLIRLLGTVSNGPNARQLEMPLKGSFKLLESIRSLLRNVKRFQKLTFLVDKLSEFVHTTISLGHGRHFEILRF